MSSTPADSGSFFSNWPRWLVAALVLGFTGYNAYDFFQHVTHRGVYRKTWAGTVVSARPSLMSVIDLFEDDPKDRWHHDDRTRNRGHYLLEVKTDTGSTIHIAVSRAQYEATLIPSYVVATDGALRRFSNRDEAVAAHAVEAAP